MKNYFLAILFWAFFLLSHTFLQMWKPVYSSLSCSTLPHPHPHPNLPSPHPPPPPRNQNGRPLTSGINALESSSVIAGQTRFFCSSCNLSKFAPDFTFVSSSSAGLTKKRNLSVLLRLYFHVSVGIHAHTRLL